MPGATVFVNKQISGSQRVTGEVVTAYLEEENSGWRPLGGSWRELWIVLGFVALGLAAARRPQAIAQAEEIFVEDETIAPETGSGTTSS